MNDFLILHRDNLLMAFDEKELIHRISGILPLTAIVTGYTVLLGFAYTYGYWSIFNVDFQVILGILSPLDMVKSLIIPFLTATFFTVFYVLGMANDDMLAEDVEKKIELSIRYNRTIKIIIFFMVLNCIWYSYKFLIKNIDFYGSLVYSFGMSLIIFWNVNNYLFRFGFYKSRRLAFFAFIIIFMPALCLNIGYYKGEPKLTSTSLIMKDNSLCSSDASDYFILLGIYNQKGVSFSVKTKNICLFNAENQNFINYTPKYITAPFDKAVI